MVMIQNEFDNNPDMLKDPSSMTKERLEDLMKKRDLATKLSNFDSYDGNHDGNISYPEFKDTLVSLSKDK
jgi:hypothetical protein